jgi:hypothetical protein
MRGRMRGGRLGRWGDCLLGLVLGGEIEGTGEMYGFEAIGKN